jgi:outer membrane protein
MKNISLIINAVLFVALGLLYILHFSSKGGMEKSDSSGALSASNDLKVAYVDIDSILVNYTLSIELNDALVKKQANMKSKLEKEGMNFQKDAQIFQEKVQKGIFLTEQRAQEAQQDLMARQQELQQMEYEYTNQLQMEQQKMNAQLFDSITNYIKVYNTPEMFQIILGHSIGGNMLYSSEKLSITNDVIAGLNKRYAKKD